MINFLRKSDALRDWYVVDGSWAVPEGKKSEWLVVIDWIENKIPDKRTFTRLSVMKEPDGSLLFYSPRNRYEVDDVVKIEAEDVKLWLEQAKRLLNEQP